MNNIAINTNLQTPYIHSNNQATTLPPPLQPTQGVKLAEQAQQAHQAQQLAGYRIGGVIDVHV